MTNHESDPQNIEKYKRYGLTQSDDVLKYYILQEKQKRECVLCILQDPVKIGHVHAFVLPKRILNYPSNIANDVSRW